MPVHNTLICEALSTVKLRLVGTFGGTTKVVFEETVEKAVQECPAVLVELPADPTKPSVLQTFPQ